MKALLETDLDRGRAVSIVLAMLIVGGVWAFTADGPGGFASYQVADSTADWLVTREALDGGDPYDDVREIAARTGTDYVVYRDPSVGSGAFVHPRPPGALLLQAPTVLIPVRLLHILMAMTVTGALGVLLVVAQRLTDAPMWLVYAGILAFVVAPSTAVGIVFGVQSGIIAILIYAGWSLSRRGDGWLAGGLVGLAGTLKLFPVLLVVVFMRYRRWRAATALIAVVGLLNAAGLAWFGLGLGQTRSGLEAAVATWLPFDANASIGGALGSVGLASVDAGFASWMLAFGLAVVVAARRPVFDLAYVLVVVLAILGSPLSWGHYDIALLPFVALAMSYRPRGPARVLIAGWPVAYVLSGLLSRVGLRPETELILAGSIALASRVALFIGVAMVAARLPRLQDTPSV